ncbi:MAG: transposase [Nannocystaceae bacterium]
MAVGGRDRQRLERVCRYIARPAIATQRLSELDNGKLFYEFRKPWRDGTRGMVFTPEEFIERLCVLVPPPQANMLRYHGALAPASKLRAKVVADRRKSGEASVGAPALNVPIVVGETECGAKEEPRPRKGITFARTAELFDGRPPGRASTDNGAAARCEAPARRMSWVDLMKRVFALDVLKCGDCGGRMKITAEITDRDAAAKILESLGLPAEVPEIARARPPRQLGLADQIEPIDDIHTHTDAVLTLETVRREGCVWESGGSRANVGIAAYAVRLAAAFCARSLFEPKAWGSTRFL